MQLMIIAAVVAIVALLSARGLWDRFRGNGDYGIEPWMLRVEGLAGLCRDYLDLIREMRSGQHDRETIHYLDSQRQVAHDQILGYLGLDRTADLDVAMFARRYLEQ
ncbi:MAG: hypothetical protein IPP13_28355 [Kouleothrix sp.]|jgi:hypothetical protein|nr:hypothetical protein [Kouleothrix sp.]